jgi:hypothetical protein
MVSFQGVLSSGLETFLTYSWLVGAPKPLLPSHFPLHPAFQTWKAKLKIQFVENMANGGDLARSNNIKSLPGYSCTSITQRFCFQYTEAKEWSPMKGGDDAALLRIILSSSLLSVSCVNGPKTFSLGKVTEWLSLPIFVWTDWLSGWIKVRKNKIQEEGVNSSSVKCGSMGLLSVASVYCKWTYFITTTLFSWDVVLKAVTWIPSPAILRRMVL